MRHLAVAAALALAACATAPAADPGADPAADEAAIRAANDVFSAAVIAGDIDAIVAAYTDDAVLLPDGRAPVRGEDGVRTYWTPREGTTITAHETTELEIEVVGSIAHDIGVYELSGETDGAPWGPVRGTYILVWERGEDGVWRITRDAWARAE